jgi:predicted nucleotidyltransferase
MFGLQQVDILRIEAIFSRYPEIEKVIIFGSRALGNYKAGSDVDLALFGDLLTEKIIASIHFELNENSLMPYFFDVINYHSIRNDSLKDHINQQGKLIYERKNV